MTALAPAPRPSTAPPAGRRTAATRPVAATSAQLPGVQPAGLPGPKLYWRLRLGLVIAVLTSTVLAVVAISLADLSATMSAQADAYAHNLSALRVMVAQTRAYGLLSAADPTNQGWYDTANQLPAAVDGLMAEVTMTAPSTQVAGDLLTAVRQWQASLTRLMVSAGDDAGSSSLANTIELEAPAYAQFDDVLVGRTQSAATDFGVPPSAAVWLGASLTLSCLAAAALILALVLTARRSHRVLNLGLVVTLAALIVTAVIVGRYLSQSTTGSAPDQTNNPVAAQVLTWTALSDNALGLLDEPWQATSHFNAAANHLHQAAATSSTSVDDLIMEQDQIAAAPADQRASLIANALPQWTMTTEAMANSGPTSPARPQSTWLVDLCLVVGLGLLGLVGVLAGIHWRVKEYR